MIVIKKKINATPTSLLLKKRYELLNSNQQNSKYFQSVTEEVIRRLNISLRNPLVVDHAEVTDQIKKRRHK